jgi:peptide/nickel transport system permease protein
VTRVAIYYLSRLINYFVVMLIAFSIVFFFLRLMPGNPVENYLQSLVQMGIRTEGSAQIVETYTKKFGLDQPLLTQYTSALQRTFLDFDLGVSLMNYPRPVQPLIMLRLPWSIWLLGLATLIAWTLGILAGTVAGWLRGTRFDSVLYNLAISLAQVPQYLVGLLLVLIFPFALGILPAGGAYSAGVVRGFSLGFILSVLYSSILPALSIVIVSAFFWLLTTRALTISILGEDYILFAEAKGLKRLRILNRYILRNTLLPQITGFAVSLAFIVNGFYLIEWIFRYPGIGSLLVAAVGQRDFNVVQGIILLSIFTVLTANLIVDLIYPLIDPRIRTAAERA